MMKTRRKVKPGQPGTKRLMELYGSNLVCVRYRYDFEANKRYTTAEIIVDEGEWIPKDRRFRNDEIVIVRVAFEDVELQKRVSRVGAIWDDIRCVWKIRYNQAVELGLRNRIEKNVDSNIGNK